MLALKILNFTLKDTQKENEFKITFLLLFVQKM